MYEQRAEVRTAVEERQGDVEEEAFQHGSVWEAWEGMSSVGGVPVEFEVRCEDEFSRVIYRSPHQAQDRKSVV